MKKSPFVFATMALLAVGCTLEENFQDIQTNELELTITATREGDETMTRTYRDDSDMSIWWIPGDAISLFYGSGTNGGSKFTSVNTTDTTKVTNFTGVITAITGGGEIAVDQTYFWGLYPYQEDASCDGTSVTMTLPKEQTAVPGTFATNTFPSLGRSQGLTMGFYNICSGMKFSVTKEGIKKVTLKSRNGELLTGKAKVGFEGGIPVAEIIDGSDEVVLEAPAGEYFEPGKYYFLVMFPTKFTNGFTVTLETFTEEATVEKTGTINAKRSNFGRIANIDTGATYSKKTGNIPVEDANFKAYLVENFDGNGDGEISYEEAEAITSIDVCTDEIESVRGIEFMENLQSLKCAGNYTSLGQLTSLDISNNTSLIYLDCSDNQLNDLDLSKNVELKTLYCSSNWFSTVNVSNNTALELFWCQGHQLTSLDVSNNTALVSLQCSDNQLTELDLSNNTALSWIHCASNQLTTLELPKTNSLSSLWCDNNQLTSLDVSSCTGLTGILCDRNQLTSLDVSKNTALTRLYCGENQLTALDVSKNTALTSLSCQGNQLTAIDISKNTELTTLSCYDNPLSTLDVSSNIALRILQCGRTPLSALDVSSNIALESLWCPDCLLTTLDLSNNAALKTLQCYKNQLISLDVSKNALLTILQCSPMNDSNGNNLMATLYVSQGQEIQVLQLPSETQIVVKPDNGGGEGTGEDDWGDGN
ncbi:MAG: hypothetical protein J6Y06_09520 [Bacteroidales bacterium]|nr:hypothetical protein [Bacteroidales bacterium]